MTCQINTANQMIREFDRVLGPAPRAIIGPTEIFVDTFCQRDAHVKEWRWHWFAEYGIKLRRSASTPHVGVR